MKLIEYDGKKLLAAVGVQILPSVFLAYTATKTKAFTSDTLSTLPEILSPLPETLPWSGETIIKAQVLQGRRGQRGLIATNTRISDLPNIIKQIKKNLETTPCAGFLLEPKLTDIKTEWFVSIDIDRAVARPRLNISQNGGGAVTAAQSFLLKNIVAGNESNECASLPIAPPLQKICQQLLELFWQENILKLEINPLAERANGTFVALDAKIELDDAARALHTNWPMPSLSPLNRPHTEREIAYRALLNDFAHQGTLGHYVESDGDIALLLFGGGASLLALDALHRANGQPANYVELSGNPDPEKVAAATRIVLSKPNLRALWIAGSFANFTDILTMTKVILTTIETLGLAHQLPIFIRRDGPQAAAAAEFARDWAERTGAQLIFHHADTDFDNAAQELIMTLQTTV